MTAKLSRRSLIASAAMLGTPWLLAPRGAAAGAAEASVPAPSKAAKGADAPPPPYVTLARNAILLNQSTGDSLFEKDADTPVEPASMSKLMTMVMVFERLRSGALSLDQEFLVSTNAWKKGGAASGGSTMYAIVNSRVKLSDLIQGVIVQSANDACIAIAEGIAGSEEAFADMMTARAREMGLRTATFRNATGLPDPEHRISVRELALLAEYIIREFPEYYKYYSEPAFTWNKITQENRNPLLKDYPGADGMKTGFTKDAGYGLVGSAARDGRRLIMVIAGLPTASDRKQEAQKLLDWGFRQFRSLNAYAQGEVVGRARVWGGQEAYVNLVAHDPVRIMLSPAERRDVKVEVVYKGPLLAPVTSGQPVGEVRFVVHGKVVGSMPVFAAADVVVTGEMWRKAMDRLMIMALGG